MRVLKAGIILSFFIITSCKKKTTEPENPPQAPSGGIYIYSNESGNYDIYMLKTDGSYSAVINTQYDEKYPFYINGKIYFSANDDGDFDIYYANEDGSGRAKFIDLPLDQLEPAVSPDENYIAFTSQTQNGGFVINLYELQSKTLLKTFGYDNMQNISPYFVDNNTLIMILQDFQGNYSQEIWVYKLQEDSLYLLKSSPSYQEGHARVKNSKIVFTRMGLYGENPHIVIADYPSLSNESIIYSGNIISIRPVFSPDGKKIALSHQGMGLIVTVDISTGDMDTLYNKSGIEAYTYFWK